MMTRREWMRQAAGVTAVAAIPGLLGGRCLAEAPANGGQAITGAGRQSLDRFPVEIAPQIFG